MFLDDLRSKTFEQRAQHLKSVSEEIVRIDATIDHLQKQIEKLSEKGSRWSAKLDQVGVTVTVGVPDAFVPKLGEYVADQFRSHIAMLAKRKMDLCRFNPDDRTNGEAWAQEQAEKQLKNLHPQT